MRIKFARGKQREFFVRVLESLGCPSLHELLSRGVGMNYQTLKNYYCERRFLPGFLFEDLLRISGLKMDDFEFEEVGDAWGQIKGGKKSRK